jgi:hypothetical protein
MSKGHETEILAKEIQRLLIELENYFWDVFAYSDFEQDNLSIYEKVTRQDTETWLFHGTRELYYKICLFLELKEVPIYLKMFTSKFGQLIDEKKKVLEGRAPLYDASEPTLIIHDDFRDFLSGFSEFDHSKMNRFRANRLKFILENTNNILARTNTKILREASIYKAVRWFIELVYPETRKNNKSRFVKKFTCYMPDILVPEIKSSIEYKMIRKGSNAGKYTDQLKTDADSYTGDPEYSFFYAVVFFEDKNDLNKAAFEHAIIEKKFPANWLIIPQ